MKKVLFASSVLLNLALIVFAVWVLSGRGSALDLIAAIELAHQRWVSQFDLLDVGPGDTAFARQWIPGLARRDSAFGRRARWHWWLADDKNLAEVRLYCR